jgi:two-component system, LytTR family, sensor kinase
MSFTSRAAKRLPILAFSVAWWAIYFWVLVSWFGLETRLAAMDALGAACWTMASMALMETILNRYTPKIGKYQFVIGLSLVVSFLFQWIANNFYQVIGKGNIEYLQFNEKAIPVRLAIIFLSTVGYGIAYLFYKQAKELQEAVANQTSTESMVREAELQKLQLQLQPHFLFNSLNSINALILVDPAKAREMVQQLSDFLRSTLKRADEHWITLDQELAYLQLYLSIEKVRFGHRLEVQMECDEQIKRWLIPPLLIQPLVENAIKFGLYGTTENVVISMKTQRVSDSLQIEIVNPFDADMQPAEGSGFGLNGLKRRLYLLYTRNDLLKTTIENDQFTVQLTLPEIVDKSCQLTNKQLAKFEYLKIHR